MKDFLPVSMVVAVILIVFGAPLGLTLILSFIVFPIVLLVSLTLYENFQSNPNEPDVTVFQSSLVKDNSSKSIHDSEFNVSRTWRSNYDFNRVINELSKTMKKALRMALLNDSECKCSKNTLKALKNRKLCHETGELTSQGWIVAVALSSLKRQLEELTLSSTEINLPYNKHPEPAVLDFLLKNQNYNGVSFTEGGDIQILLYCMCFTEILDVKRAEANSSESSIRGSMYTCPFGHSPLSNEETLSAISRAQKSDIKYAFYTIKEWHRDLGWEGDNWPFRNYIGLRFGFINSLYQALGNNTLVKVAESYLEDPFAFGKGWPDLTAIDPSYNVKLLEVKTTDKFHPSQIVTISKMRKFFPIEVIKVN